MQFPIRSWTALVLAVLALAGQAHAQSGYDRRGGDYLRFEIRSGDPAVCATRCERDARCHAWSLLISAHRKCNRSLLVEEQSAAARGSQMLRIGCSRRWCGSSRARAQSNIPSTALEAIIAIWTLRLIPPARACKAACEADNKCRAWTYVRPGYIAPSARCYLKDKITRPRLQAMLYFGRDTVAAVSALP